MLYIQLFLLVLVEPVLELLLNRVDFVVKGSVSPVGSLIITHWVSLWNLSRTCMPSTNHDWLSLHLPLRLPLHLPLHLSLHLLLLDDRLNVGRFVQIDSVLILKVFNVVVEEGFIVTELLSDWKHADLVDGCLGAHGLQREEQLLADVDDLSCERGPLRLRLDQRTFGVLLFLLEDEVVLLKKDKLLFELL